MGGWGLTESICRSVYCCPALNDDTWEAWDSYCWTVFQPEIRFLKLEFVWFSPFFSLFSSLSWFNPSQQRRTTQGLTPFPPHEMGDRTGKVKVTKLMDWDKDCLIGKAKTINASKANKEVIRYFSSASRCSAISRKAGLHHAQWLLGKTSIITLNVPASPFYSPFFVA